MLREHDLEPEASPRMERVELENGRDLARSRVLHRIRALGMPGFELVDGSDFVSRSDLVSPWEEWSVRWSPEFEAASVEAAIYGATLEEAASARVVERAEELGREAEGAALLLLDARRMGLGELHGRLFGRLVAAVRADGDFVSVTGALGHLLYLYRYDEALGSAGDRGTGELLGEAFVRGLWLLEGLGQVSGRDRELLRGVRSLQETCERCGDLEGAGRPLDRERYTGVLRRVGEDGSQSPLVRGAAAGCLWRLGEARLEDVLASLRLFAEPADLGDYFTGLFALAREVAQREAELVLALDAALGGYDDERFLAALPSLRLAFSYFTPREKHHLASTLLQAVGEGEDGRAPLPALQVSAEEAAAVMAWEGRLYAAVERYGLGRGDGRGPGDA